MKKVLITGGKGRIGLILRKGLSRFYKIKIADLPEHDLRKYSEVLSLTKNVDFVIHLAWNTKVDNWASRRIDPKNSQIFSNIYRASLKNNVKRVIIASSIHADDFKNFKGKSLMKISRFPNPTSPYGAHKIFMETLGEYFAKQGLEVVCIRFGAVGYGEPPKDEEGKKVWLSKRDTIELLKKVIRAKKVPGKFCIIYGVSNNKQRIHDFSNPFGWKPKEGVN